MAKPSRPHPIFDLARTRNRNTTWDGLIMMMHGEDIHEGSKYVEKSALVISCSPVAIVVTVCIVDIIIINSYNKN